MYMNNITSICLHFVIISDSMNFQGAYASRIAALLYIAKIFGLMRNIFSVSGCMTTLCMYSLPIPSTKAWHYESMNFYIHYATIIGWISKVLLFPLMKACFYYTLQDREIKSLLSSPALQSVVSCWLALIIRLELLVTFLQIHVDKELWIGWEGRGTRDWVPIPARIRRSRETAIEDEHQSSHQIHTFWSRNGLRLSPPISRSSSGTQIQTHRCPAT